MNVQPAEANRLTRANWFSRIGLLAVLAIILAVACLLFTRPEDPELPEVARSALVLMDGKLCLTGQTNPFTGFMIERHESGTLKSRSAISEGLLHGLSEGWHANQQLQVAEHFSHGVSDGIRTKWHENGRMHSQVMVVEGNLHGTFKRWNEEGALTEVIEMQHGHPHGLSRAFYPSGFLKAEATLRQGEVIQSRFWKDGECPAPSWAAVNLP